MGDADVQLRGPTLPSHGARRLRRFVEGYAKVAVPLTAPGSPNVRSVRSPDAQASFEALKQALSQAPVLRTFDPRRRAVLTTDARGLAVAAILTQPDDEGHQLPQLDCHGLHGLDYANRRQTKLTKIQTNVLGIETKMSLRVVQNISLKSQTGTQTIVSHHANKHSVSLQTVCKPTPNHVRNPNSRSVGVL